MSSDRNNQAPSGAGSRRPDAAATPPESADEGNVRRSAPPENALRDAPPSESTDEGRAFSVIRRAWNCLGWRLVILVTFVLLGLLGASGWLALQLHRAHLIGFMEENVANMGETILWGTHASMLENDQRHLTQIVESVGRRDGVLALRIFDSEGEVRHSSLPVELGRFGDLTAPTCRGCHETPGSALVPASPRDGLHLYRDPKGQGSMGMVVPILNTAECANASCHVHDPGQRVLGILDLEVSTASLDRAMGDARHQMLILLLITALAAPTAIGIVSWRLVHRPLRRLWRAIRRVEQGELEHRVPTNVCCEMGELAVAFNEMSARVQRADQALRASNETLERRVEEKSQELERTRDRIVVAEKMASLGKLAAIVAHEINNPLAGVLVCAKLVRRKLTALAGTLDANDTPGAVAADPGHGTDPLANGTVGRESRPEGIASAVPRRGESVAGDAPTPAPSAPEPPAPPNRFQEMNDLLQTIERETARCGDIARNLLSMSRQSNTAFTAESISEIVERSLKLTRHQAEIQGIELDVSLAPELPRVECLAGEVQQAVTILVMNAIEAMPHGGRLVVRTMSIPKGIRLEVADTGPGIP
ncbi:MAG: HAMP domain-containing protein, partial [Candidatus Eisenbacteria bacterium]|nr:HAMP domain-containing protein [Candidatus Eisenbacteria bacterium]